ncbi:MAG: ABC transporter ATP-binding protein [Clostridia bacterium]|nr:ABC transporter ATP-binding protein [Clostridia bacterium]
MKQQKTSGKIVLRILKDTKPIAGWLVLGAFVALFSVALSLVTPEILRALSDRLYDYWEPAHLGQPATFDNHAFALGCVLLAAAYAGSSLAAIGEMLIMNNVVSKHFTCVIRIRMSDKIRRLPVRYVDQTPNGEIISHMTDDVSTMGTTIHSFLETLISGVLKLIGIIVLIFLLNPILAAAVIVFVPLSLILSAKIAGKSEKYFAEVRKKNGEMYALTEETFTGFDTVKAFHLEKRQQKRQAELCDDMREAARKGTFLASIVQPIVALSNNIAYIAICIIGGIFVANNLFGMSVGTIVAFVLYARMFAGPLESIAQGFSMLQHTIASAERVYRMLDEEEMTETAEETAPEGKGNVQFESVDFSYDPKQPLIKGLTINVHAGEKVAIVGPTGGGKTTIVNLLMRFYDVDGGRILVDGKDVMQMPRNALRSVFSMVLQDTWLFSGTIYDNIAYGRPDATEEEVHEAAKRAHVDRFIRSLPNGYDTVINEETTNISGGQKQLLTIARAYLANRPILILDEATSNVDTRTEILIQRTMDDLMRDRTSFVIAHRLSTIVDADTILVVNNGSIVEQGTHRELLEKNGFYAEIYNSQYELLN